MRDKKNQRELERLFPDAKVTTISKPLLKNLNLQLEGSSLPDPRAAKAIVTGDE